MEVLVQESRSQDLLIFLYKLYQEQLLCDMDIEAGDGVTFCIHRVVLASTSSYVHHMILSNPVLSKLKLDVSSKALQLLLEFGYTGRLFVSSYLRQDVLYAATVLQMNSVLDLMKNTKLAEEVCEETDKMSTAGLVQDNTTDMGNFEGCQVVIKTEPLDPETMKIESVMQNRGHSNRLESSKQVGEKFECKHKNKEPQTDIESNIPHAKRENRSSRQKSSTDRNHLKSICDSNRRPKDWKVNLRYKLIPKNHIEIYLKWLFSRFLIKKSLRHRLGSEYSNQQTGSNKRVCCNGCGKNFSRYSLLFLHFNRTHFQHSRRSWLSFPSLHLKSKLNTTSYVVAEKSAQSLKKKKFKCLSRCKEFGFKTGLNTHFKKIHENINSADKKQKKEAMSLSIVKLKCLLCDKEMQSEAGLCRHLMIPHQKKRFECKFCTKSYCQKGKLNFHIQITHGPGTGTLPTKCLYCDKQFATRYGKRRHENLVHLGKKDLRCDICGKAFGNKHGLMGHVRSTHMKKDDRLNCGKCNATFSYTNTLKEHQERCGKKIEKHFQCSQCSAKFTSKRSKDRHEKSQHGDASHICEFCGEEFRYKSSYKRHIKRKHEKEH